MAATPPSGRRKPCRLLHLSPPAGRGRLASEALAKRSKSGEGAIPQARTRGDAPSPGFLRSAALRSESDLSPHAAIGFTLLRMLRIYRHLSAAAPNERLC